jgi:transcriptional regulator with XRE-family HTH domain
MLGKFIHKLRKEHNLTQEFLASELGISRPTYLQIEQDARELTISEAQKLANIFGILFADFLAAKEPARSLLIKEDSPKLESKLTIRVTKKNPAKFKQVLLYILEKVGGKPNVGETVLYKLLYFIDFDYYEKYEENLMGATYIKNQYGPTPLEFNAIVQQMKKKHEIEEVKSEYFKFPQKKYLALQRADLALFTGREIEHIDEVLARLSDKNAKELSDYSHGDIPWLTREFGEELAYESVFYRDEKYSVRNYDDDL